jgi:2-polyprenyl-3-methyl-5-hydroxy-6-metoxy-1,4-benzoquinol methylase
METTLCNYCGSGEANFRFKGPDLLLDRPAPEYTLVQCTRCGLVYQNPRPTPAEIIEHYPAEYGPYADHGEQARQSWLLTRAYEYGIAKRCRYVTRHKHGGALLDVGCASGTFLRGIAARGAWQVYGVELNEAVAAFAREQYGLDVFAGRLEEAGYPNHLFDVVTMWDVLEHVHDPHDVLREVRRILKPDGILVVRVPNLASLEASIFGQYWAGLDLPRHLYVFTPDTLAYIMANAGLEVMGHSTGIGAYATFVLSAEFFLNSRQVSSVWKSRILRTLNHPVARVLSAPFFYFSNLTLKGSLLVTTAKVGDGTTNA